MNIRRGSNLTPLLNINIFIDFVSAMMAAERGI